MIELAADRGPTHSRLPPVELGACADRLPAPPRLDPARRGVRAGRATGSGSSRESPASTCPGTRATTSCARESRPRSASSGLVVAAVVPVDLCAAPLAARLRRDARADDRRLRRRRDDPRLEALDRSRLHPVPAVGAREGPVRARHRGVRRRPRRTRHALANDLLGHRPGRRSRSCSCSSQPDLGTALVYSAALFAVLFFVGVRWRQLLALLAIGVIGIASVLWLLPAAGIQVLKPYQAARLDPRSRRRSRRDHLQPEPVDHRRRLGRSDRARRGRGEPDAARLPPRARDRLCLRVARRAAGIRRARAILLLLYLLVVWRGLRVVTGGRGSLRGRGRWRAGGRVPLPDLRERRYDDGRCAGDGHSAPVRDGRWLVDGGEPRPDRRPPGHPRSRRARGRTASVSAAGFRALAYEARSVVQTARDELSPASVGPIVVSGMLAEQLTRELGAGAAAGCRHRRRRRARACAAEVLVRVSQENRPRPTTRSFARRSTQDIPSSSSSSGRRRTGRRPSSSPRSSSNAAPGEGFPAP